MANDILVHGDAGKLEIAHRSADSSLSLGVTRGAASSTVGSSVSYRESYREISDRPQHQGNVLEQLNANISHLEELHSRLSFMMGEVRTLLKRS